MNIHVIKPARGVSIDHIAPEALADSIAAFLAKLPEDDFHRELDECLEPAIKAICDAGFPPEDVASWRDYLSDPAMLRFVELTGEA